MQGRPTSGGNFSSEKQPALAADLLSAFLKGKRVLDDRQLWGLYADWQLLASQARCRTLFSTAVAGLNRTAVVRPMQ